MLPFLFSPPFTIQRLCELVVNPRQHYKRKDNYMRAMEKVRPCTNGYAKQQTPPHFPTSSPF